jgi:hypothetical protein
MRDRYGKAQRSRIVMKNVPPAYTLTWRSEKLTVKSEKRGAKTFAFHFLETFRRQLLF